jgi:hypothetical protein
MSDTLFQTGMKGLLMKNSPARFLTWVAITGATLFLGACINSNDEPAIDPAYKNTKVDARIAGQSLSTSFDQGKDWSSTMTTPEGIQPLGSISTKVGTLKKQSALPKRTTAGAGDEFQVNFDDTAAAKGGFLTVYTESNLLLVVTKDTAKVKWDDKARDSIKDNENVISWKRVATYIGGKVESAEFKDGDNDGIVTPVPGKDNRVRMTLKVSENGVVENTIILVGAGPDINFDQEADNTVIEASWTKTKDGVAIGQGAYLDGDGDGIVTDNSKTCVVLVKYSEMDPKDRPLVKKVTLEAKIRVFPKSIGGDEPVTFAYEEEMKSGRTNSATIKNRAGGPEFVKGDTLTVRLETSVKNVDDTLKHATIEIIMNPGQNLSSDLDDTCYAIHVTSEKKYGFERSAEFNFVSAHPIPHGQEPTAGSFDGKATYANGKTASLKGSFSPSGYSAEYIGPDGGTAKVEYTKGGDLLSGGNI